MKPERRHAPNVWRVAQDAARRGSEEAAVPGRRAALEAIAAGRAVRVVLAAGAGDPLLRRVEREAERAGVPIVREAAASLQELAGGERHQGVVVLVRPYATYDVADILNRARRNGEAPLVVVAAGLEDPRNLGAVARSAEGAGAHGLIVPARRAAPVSPAAARTAAGALEHLPVAVVPNAARALYGLKKEGVWVYGADPGGDRTYWDVDWTTPAAVVVGGEGTGLSRIVREACDGLVRIPMRGSLGSLNASVAAAIVLYEAVRQRSAVR